ncbi:MAG: LacI family DNA-binding transcriptional regulator, partial [Albidovulum sp.]|nr:LacI family DNA-binding transcriptional regulator [Albidovulum sp.]
MAVKSPRRPTVKDVARCAGLSVASVSRALASPDGVRPRTKELVLEAVRKTGYRVNQTAAELRTGRSRTLLVLVSEITNAFFAEFFKGIEEEARENGYVLLIGDLSEAEVNEHAFSDILLRNQAGGLILNTFVFLDDLLPKESTATYSGPPVVSCNGHRRIAVPVVRIDDELGGRLAAEHLIKLGHRRIAEVGGQLSVKAFERRHRGFRRALEAVGIAVAKDRWLEGRLSTDFGLEAARKIISQPRPPTAVFAHNDETAIGLLHGLARAGLQVPE